MWEAFIGSLIQVFHWRCMAYLFLGTLIGFWVGILPGLGGGTTLCLMLSFIFNMTPVEAFAFLLGMHSVVATTGDLTSILIGVPGEGSCAATILDGFPMTKKGEAGRAMGAALMSSLIGALFGAFVLLASIPILRPLVLLLGAPELLMLALLGISCISSLSGGDLRGQMKGFATGFAGLLLSGVGADPFWGLSRYSYGSIYLTTGFGLVPVMIGLFAMPEIIDLAIRRNVLAYEAPGGRLGAGVWQGIKDTFTYWGLTLRCSAVGAWIGFVPGIGSSVSQWMAYAMAVQSAHTPEERSGFGKGDVRGVLGPGACNNSKEGGSLIPTLAFGVPGTSAMAILLGAFMIKGLVPGPDMLTKHLDVTFSMVWSLTIANILTVLICIAFVKYLAKITICPGSIIVPFVLLLVAIGSYASSNQLFSLLVTFCFGTLGYLMNRVGWPRAPLVIGFVLGPLIEVYLQISMSRFGYSWMYRPWVIIIFLLILVTFIYPFWKEYRWKREGKKEVYEVYKEV